MRHIIRIASTKKTIATTVAALFCVTLATTTTTTNTATAQTAPDPVAIEAAAKQAFAQKLGRHGHFMIGLGNDVTAAEGWEAHYAQAYGLGANLDIHYMYLSNLDWPTWGAVPGAPEGSYITKQANAAKAHFVTPMFTLYQAAAWGEANIGVWGDPRFMTQYWHNVRVMYQRLAELGTPSIVHLEPDLWGYFQKANPLPSGIHVKVSSLVPECSDLPEDVSGFGKCLVRLGRVIAPQTVIGLSASSFGAATATGISDPTAVATYLNSVGSVEADYLAVETLDRDAGCFENGSDPLCKRPGAFYWDETNTTSPSFHDHLAWARTVHAVTAKPLLWWQMPLGVPNYAAGWPGHYRDNRVSYLFAHPQEFMDAGGVGAVFGSGAPNQTMATTDGGQFRNAVTRYYAAPILF